MDKPQTEETVKRVFVPGCIIVDEPADLERADLLVGLGALAPEEENVEVANPS